VVGGQETFVQKNRVKALDGDRNALKQKLRLSVFPAHERNSPTQIVKKKSGRLIDRTQGLDRDRLEVIVTLQEAAISATQPLQDPARQDQCKSQRWCRQLSHPTSRTCHLQKESVWDHLVSCRFDVPSQSGSLASGTPAATKARATRSFSVWCLDDLPGACLQTRLCRSRASTGEPHRQRWGTHKSSPRRKPTGNAAPKYQKFPLFCKELPRRGDSLDRFRKF